MSNEIINQSAEQAGQNADEQEVAQAPAATTKSPVNDTMDEQQNNDSKPSADAVTEKEKTIQPVAESTKAGTEEDALPDFHKVQVELLQPGNFSNLKFRFMMPFLHLLTMILTGPLTKEMLLLTTKRKGKGMMRCMIKPSSRLMTMK